MTAQFCLLPTEVSRFKKALIDGEINPEKLSSMTSEERHALLSKITGEGNAKGVNALFESKLLLKNQQQGMVTWAKKISGITPEVRRTLESKIAKLDRVLNPEEEKAFLKDLASTRLGVDVSVKEAKQIAQLSARVQEAEALPRSSKAESLKKSWTPTENDLEYGRARYDFHTHINDLKNGAKKLTIQDFKGRNILKAPPRVIKAFVDSTKSIGASLDDSFALRQGLKTFWTDNRLWQKQFLRSFVNLAKGFKDAEGARRELQARLMADPHYDQAIKDGLAIKGNEDVFPTSLPEKLPLLGRPFGASEVAYNAFAENLRLDLYKKYMSQKLGDDIPVNFGKNNAKLANSMTGRGGFGKYDPVAGPLNVAFYSARFLKSNVDTLLLHPLGSGVGGTADFIRGKEGAVIASAAQKKAAINLAKIIAGTAAVLATADKLMPGSVDFDPRSSNFGKIKIGDTRFDVSGGMGSIVELAAQLAQSSSKNATTGLVSKLNTNKYGSQTQVDAVINFLEGKTSPVGGVLLDFGKGKTHQNTKPTAKNEVGSLATPLGVKNYQELKQDPNSANILASVLADIFGISANTYGQSQKNWSLAPTNAQQEFLTKIGQAKFNEANQVYNREVDAWNKANLPSLKDQSNATKQAIITAAKAKIQKQVFKKYGYTVPKSKPDKNTQNLKKNLLQSIK